VTTIDPLTVPPAVSVARRLREEERMRRIIADKTAPRDAALAEERRARAEAHRIAALPALADRLAEAVFNYAEHAENRVMVRDQLAHHLHLVLLGSGLARDPRFPPTGGV
jgi:hypothetical protein